MQKLTTADIELLDKFGRFNLLGAVFEIKEAPMEALLIIDAMAFASITLWSTDSEIATLHNICNRINRRITSQKNQRLVRGQSIPPDAFAANRATHTLVNQQALERKVIRNIEMHDAAKKAQLKRRVTKADKPVARGVHSYRMLCHCGKEFVKSSYEVDQGNCRCGCCRKCGGRVAMGAGAKAKILGVCFVASDGTITDVPRDTPRPSKKPKGQRIPPRSNMRRRQSPGKYS